MLIRANIYVHLKFDTEWKRAPTISTSAPTSIFEPVGESTVSFLSIDTIINIYTRLIIVPMSSYRE